MDKWEVWQIVFALMGIVGLGIMGALLIGTCSAEMSEIEEFLTNDTTEQHEYLPWYTCGHYSRDLANNATNYNISMGSVILGDRSDLGGKWNSHIMNYVILNGSIWVIEPQTDQIIQLEDMHYLYYRLYSDGTQVPSNWGCNFATEMII